MDTESRGPFREEGLGVFIFFMGRGREARVCMLLFAFFIIIPWEMMDARDDAENECAG